MKYKVGDIVFSTIWNKSVLIKDIRPNRFYLIADLEYLSRTMVTYESNLKSREDDIEKDMEEHQKLCDEIMAIQGIEPIEAEIEEVWHCPEGYIFKDENGNVINATKIILEKKKKEYPKTYKECCKVLNIAVRDLDILDNMLDTTEIIYNKNLDRLLNSFRKLLICRNAYWKLYGGEMGLGKPWEPDYSGTFEHGTPIKYIIYNIGTYIVKERKSSPNHILVFPTVEIRDAFYENFKELIEQCKELL